MLIAAGAGLLSAPVTSTATAGVAPADAGAAAGLMSTTKQFGAATGLAALVATTAPRSAPASCRLAFLASAGLLLAPTAALALPRSGAAAGLMSTTKQFGAATGLAALVATTAPRSAPASCRLAFLASAGLLLAPTAALALPRSGATTPLTTARPSARPGPG